MRNRYRVVLSIALAFVLGFASAFPITDTADKYISKEQEKKWTVEDSKAYALDQLLDWHYKEYRCLVQLWGKESAWRPEAFNKIKVMGKNAGGIPQLLGLDPKTPPTQQIDRGLKYIYHRYDTPCNAWSFFQKKGYH
jgi:hypothetical protein